jgi:hypothetical protein
MSEHDENEMLIKMPGQKTSMEEMHGRYRCRWNYNVKIYFRKVGCDKADWIRLSQDRVQWEAFVHKLMNF